MAKRWTPEEDEVLLLLHGEGLSSLEISVRIHRSPSAIRKRLSSLNAPKTHRIWTPQEKELAFTLKEQGHTNKYIAKKLNRSLGSINTLISRNWHNDPH